MGREDRLASALAAVNAVSQRTLPISTGGEEGEGAPAVAARPSQQQAAAALPEAAIAPAGDQPPLLWRAAGPCTHYLRTAGPEGAAAAAQARNDCR